MKEQLCEGEYWNKSIAFSFPTSCLKNTSIHSALRIILRYFWIILEAHATQGKQVFGISTRTTLERVTFYWCLWNVLCGMTVLWKNIKIYRPNPSNQVQSKLRVCVEFRRQLNALVKNSISLKVLGVFSCTFVIVCHTLSPLKPISPWCPGIPSSPWWERDGGTETDREGVGRRREEQREKRETRSRRDMVTLSLHSSYSAVGTDDMYYKRSQTTINTKLSIRLPDRRNDGKNLSQPLQMIFICWWEGIPWWLSKQVFNRWVPWRHIPKRTG